jgi:hypothetical protein
VYPRYLSTGLAQATGWTAGVRFAVGARDFSLLYIVDTGSVAHLTSILVATGSSFPGRKTHLHLVPRSGMAELNLHSLIRIHGLVLNLAQRQLYVFVPVDYPYPYTCLIRSVKYKRTKRNLTRKVQIHF